ncbi:MAG: diguanylate cyclase [Sulfuricurvum sp.]|uniref:diguanylate cyclase domain-containing protein n=1 Tax=Sulfuricurvum sp. TaxID=2025608 RepID=UPI0027352B3A|nr:diguanylate cyclase [Sulfuricurvum sp.]MDP3292057.1 diguanylate cyclase [Sulfuricurvum sp.]
MHTIKNDLDTLVDEIIKELKKNDLPPIPENFRFYFDKLLETKNDDFRQKISSISPRFDENLHNEFEYERSLNHGAKAVKLILKQGSSVYKNTTLLKKIIQNKKDSVIANKNQETLLEVTASVENVLDKFLVSLEKQSTIIKELYGTAASSIKNAKRTSLYNASLGVFNKKYFITLLEKERESCINSSYESALMAVSLVIETIEIENKKAHANLIRELAKTLSNALRRSDSIAYYGDGVFSILLRHTSDEHAEIAAERFHRLISKSILLEPDSTQKNQNILMGIVQIDSCLNAEEILEQSIDSMLSSSSTNISE